MESVCRLKPTEGSNPSLSASQSRVLPWDILYTFSGATCAEDREEPTIGIDELTTVTELRARLAE